MVRYLASPTMARTVYWMSMPRSVNGNRSREEYIVVKGEYWACFIIPVTFWLLASLTLMVVFYGAKSMMLGPNSSQLLDFNPWVVTEIKVSDNGRAGPMLYGFTSRPDLNSELSWIDHHDLLLDPDYHEEFAFWLNNGSKISVNCSVKSSDSFNILVTILQGLSALQDWIQNPSNEEVASAWNFVHGQGNQLQYDVTKEDTYYIAVANLNSQSVEILLEFDIRGRVYNTDSSDYNCSLEQESCVLKTSIWGNRYALLTTPADSQIGTPIWKVEVSYGIRWVVFFGALVCILLVVIIGLLVLSCVNDTYTFEVDHASRTPLLPAKDGTHGSRTSSYGSMEEDPENSLRLEDKTQSFEGEDTYKPQICAVCFDAPRSSFFIPCGHCATCLPCAVRIQSEKRSACPICREAIQGVKVLFCA